MYPVFHEDREVIVKIGLNSEQIRGLSPRKLVERAERRKMRQNDRRILLP